MHGLDLVVRKTVYDTKAACFNVPMLGPFSSGIDEEADEDEVQLDADSN